MRSLIPLSLLLSISQYVDALKFPVQIRTTGSQPPPPPIPAHSRLQRRANATVELKNNQNAQYIANVTLGGVQVRVMVDTGSSDLWVDFPGQQPDSKNLGESLSLNYAIGSASGDIHSADLEFNGYSIPDQAFLKVKDASSFSTDIHAQGYDGLMGLGPNEGSQVLDAIDEDSADSVLSRIFQSNRSADNFITILLDRKNDPTMDYTGQMTISEIVEGFEDIVNQPKLDVEEVHRLLDQDQHWQALTDKDNGIIGPDGKIIKVDSIVPRAPDGQLVTVFDSGFTFNQVPRELADAIYGRVQGAVYDAKNEWWTVPCGQMLNLTFNFGGQAYPIHPLDTVDDSFGISDANGNTVCIGTFQPITTAFSLLGNYDMIMGMAFMRNVYTLLDFGNWVEKTDNKDDPYVQLLALTDPATAYSDFVQRRLDGEDPAGDARWALLPEDQMQKSPVSDEEKKKKYQEMILSRWPYILTGCLVGLIIIIGLIIWKCCCRRSCCGNKKNKPSKDALAARTSKGVFGKGGSESYLPLQAQGSTVSLHAAGQQQPGADRFSAYGQHGGDRYSSYSNAPQYSPHGGYNGAQYSPGAGYGGYKQYQ